MMSKGEPLELLDGDNLEINIRVFEELCKYMKEKGEEKVLILTALGP
jgi:hypothetical protein